MGKIPSSMQQMRGISDQKLHEALTNHAGVLVQILNYINYRQKTGWRQRALNVALVLGVLYCLLKATVDASLVQLGALLSHIL